MKYFKNLKTSEKISLSFSLFSFLTLVFLLFAINITYFFIWYNDQKEVSFYDMEKNYSQNFIPSDATSAENFQAFLLQSDTLIIPKEGEPVCSPGVLEKVHDNLDEIQDKLFYSSDDVLYFIYSKEYEGIGEVKVFFDTTPYINSQIIIIKISLVIIILAFFLHFFIGKIISQKLLRELKSISQRLQGIDMDGHLQKIELHGPKNDEIRILGDTLNKSFEKIETQTHNLKQFITDVSHEFKTPLMSLNSKIDVLEKKSYTTPLTFSEQQAFFGYIKQNTKNLNSLLDTLFLLSRFEEKIETFERKRVNFSEYLQTVSSQMLETHRHIQVKYDIKKDIFLEIEEVTCTIIINNLLTNALKFADTKKPHIEIGADETGFWVYDNGAGIQKGEIEKIYEKFYKGDPNKEGFGIGLFLIKRITSLYDWQIYVSSQKQKGTKVTIKFA